MNQVIGIDKFADEIQKIAEGYVEEVNKAVAEVLPKVGKDAVKELKQTSPKKTGRYAKGWTSKVEKERLSTSVSIYNKDRYQLTHLLEKGHAKVNGGRVPAHPHIKPAEDHAADNAVKQIKEKVKR